MSVQWTIFENIENIDKFRLVFHASGCFMSMEAKLFSHINFIVEPYYKI